MEPPPRLRTIEQRELWDEERKEAERIRTVLLRRYFVTASAALGRSDSFLGIFAFRYNVPILRGMAVAVRDWLAGGGIGRVLSILIVGLIIWTLLRVVRKTARALTPTGGQRFERQDCAGSDDSQRGRVGGADRARHAFYPLCARAVGYEHHRALSRGQYPSVWRSRSAHSRSSRT